MIAPFQEVLDRLEAWFRRLERDVSPPEKMNFKDGYKIRFSEKNIKQAALIKFARYISGLRASHLLLNGGYCQELGILQRNLDEIKEDLLFLALGVGTGNWTPRHDQFLKHFWSEDEDTGMVKRDKIRSYIHNAGNPQNPSSGIDAARIIFKTYSGFVHANAVTSMDMWSIDDKKFLLSGILESPLYFDHTNDIWNQFYRGLFCAVTASRIIDNSEVNTESRAFLEDFGRRYGDMIFPISGSGA